MTYLTVMTDHVGMHHNQTSGGVTWLTKQPLSVVRGPASATWRPARVLTVWPGPALTVGKHLARGWGR